MLHRMTVVSLLVASSSAFYFDKNDPLPFRLGTDQCESQDQCQETQADPNSLLQMNVRTSVAVHENASPPDETVHDDLKDVPPLDEMPADAKANSNYIWIGVRGSEYTWGDWQCALLEDLSNKDLSQCKAACAAKSGCHAINANPTTKKCELRGCAQPVPTPDNRHQLGGYDAYFMHVMTGKLCYDGERVEMLTEGGHLCHTDAQIGHSMSVHPRGYQWDSPLPSIADCFPEQGSGKLKSFTWAIKLTKAWVNHYNDHKDDFARHGYKTLQEAPGILLDKASYLFEQQFGVQLIIGTVSEMDEHGTYTPANPWQSGYAGTIRLDTTNRANSPVGSLCRNAEMLGAGAKVFESDGRFRFGPVVTLAHELGHYFGTHHTPMYKPDIMVVDGRPSYRRCGGRSCMYHSFLPWDDTTSYHKTFCVDNIQKATCATLVDPPGPTVPTWILAQPRATCSSACAATGKTCDESWLQAVGSASEITRVAGIAGQNCKNTVAWAYDFSPSICTSSDCCGNGACTGYCAFGNNGKRSCATGTSGHHSRLCPCS